MGLHDGAEETPPAPAPQARPGEAPPRVGIDARMWDDYGIGTYLRCLIPRLAAHAPRAELAALHRSPEPPRIAAPGVSWVRSRAPVYSLREQAALRRFGRGRDLLHLPHYVVPWLPACPFVVTIHDLIHLIFPEYLPGAAARGYARAMLRRAVRSSRRIIAVSETTRRALIERLGVASERIAVIAPGLPPDARPLADRSEAAGVLGRYGIEGPFLFSAGNYRMRHKNLPVLLEAYRLLREEARVRLPLVIAGDAPLAGGASGLPAAGVLRLGFIPRPDVMALCGAAEIFLWPSAYEGFGMPVLEAMGCATPVVAARGGAVPEVLGESGLLIPPGDAQALAGAVAGLLADEALRRDLGKRGLARSRDFSWDEHARDTWRVYGAAMAGSI